MAPRPSSSGISRSMSTMSGSWSCTFCRASIPFRAVPTTRNSRLPSTTSLSSRRKKGLSSTTRTVRDSEDLDAMRHRRDLESAVRHPEPHGPAEVASGGLADDGHAVLVERLARGHDVALAHLDGAGRPEPAEHAGAADEPRRDPADA